MLEIWFNQAKTKDDREAVKQDLALAYRAFRRLENILSSKIKEYPSDYNTANWAYEQADVNGYNRAIREVLKLINPKED